MEKEITNASVKQSDLQTEGEQLSIHIENLMSLVKTLENRLGGVLRPSSPIASDPKVARQPESGLGKFLQEKRMLVSTATNILGNIIDRLEI